MNKATRSSVRKRWQQPKPEKQVKAGPKRPKPKKLAAKKTTAKINPDNPQGEFPF
jgi:hypothetical protein